MITDKEVQQIRQALGKSALKMTDEEIKLLIAQTDHLLEAWMETYEKTIYNGKTFNELFSN